jgi:hypothetical protein
VGLLDDPDVRMREQALAALEKVRTRLAQTREWKAFVESLRQTSGREEGRAEEETDG